MNGKPEMQTDTAQAIGSTLPEIVATASNAPATTPSPVLDVEQAEICLLSLPERLNDRQMAQVSQIARSTLPALPAANLEHVAKCLRLMAATLKRRSMDDISGKAMVALYGRHLQGYPDEALSYLCEIATRELDWFPTPAECLRLLGRWQRDDQAARLQALARRRLADEASARYVDAGLAIIEGRMTAHDVSRMLPSIQRRLDAACLIRLDGNGQIRITASEWAASQFRIHARTLQTSSVN